MDNKLIKLFNEVIECMQHQYSYISWLGIVTVELENNFKDIIKKIDDFGNAKILTPSLVQIEEKILSKANNTSTIMKKIENSIANDVNQCKEKVVPVGLQMEPISVDITFDGDIDEVLLETEHDDLTKKNETKEIAIPKIEIPSALENFPEEEVTIKEEKLPINTFQFKIINSHTTDEIVKSSTKPSTKKSSHIKSEKLTAEEYNERVQHRNRRHGEYPRLAVAKYLTGTGEKPYQCPTCNKFFAYQIFRTHTHVRQLLGKPCFKCEVCSRVFGYKQQYESHKRIHTGDRRFECPICHKKFLRNSYLRQHVKIHSEDKEYECNVCDKKFKLAGTYQQHMYIHADKKRYKCEQCGKEFSQHSSFHNHKRTHISGNRYFCDICSHGCRTRGNFVVHMRTHTGERPFACEICKLTFRRKAQLTKHLKTRKHVEIHATQLEKLL